MTTRRLDSLPAAAFQILLALADGDLHGYGIMRQVEAQTEGRVRLGPGTLYTSIQGLVDKGWLAELPAKDGEERRRTYRLTALGRAAAREEAERLESTLRVARAKKILGGAHV